MMCRAPLSVRAIALLLVGVLPLQVGIAGLLGAATHVDGGVGHADPAVSAVHEEPEDPHGADEPCGAPGPCDTGLMTCSDEAPCATVAFFPAASFPAAALLTSFLASTPSAPPHEDAFFTADKPPPRA